MDNQGRPLDMVLKSLPHGKLSAVTGVLASMEREWAVGRRLALHCTTPAGATNILLSPSMGTA